MSEPDAKKSGKAMMGKTITESVRKATTASEVVSPSMPVSDI